MDRTIDLLGLAEVHRWNVIRTGRLQSVAEHSFGVAVIAMELVERLMGYGRLSERLSPLRLSVITWALTHDAPETFTSDIDGKFKREFRDVGLAVKAAEMLAFPWFAAASAEVHPVVRRLVKVADQIEGVVFLRSWGVGMRADDVQREMETILMEESGPALIAELIGNLAGHDPVADSEIGEAVEGVMRAVLYYSTDESNSCQFRFGHRPRPRPKWMGLSGKMSVPTQPGNRNP